MIKIVKGATLRGYFSDVLNEVLKGRGYFIVTKRGRPVSALVNLDFLSFYRMAN